MKYYPYYNILILLIAGLVSFTGCQAQESGTQLLKLEKEITLPGVKGRIDHIDINIKAQIAYIGNTNRFDPSLPIFKFHIINWLSVIKVVKSKLAKRGQFNVVYPIGHQLA